MRCVSLESLGDDILHMIAKEVYLGTRYIKEFSTVSCRVRFACMPILFSRCFLSFSHGTNPELPPAPVQPYIQHVIYSCLSYQECESDVVSYQLSCLPSGHAVTFDNTGVPWTLLKAIMSFSHVASVQFTSSALWTPFPKHEIANMPITLKQLSYTPFMWREILADRHSGDLEAHYASEAHRLGTLVPLMSSVAQSLSLPFETSPLERMAQSPWPHLQALSLSGRSLSIAQLTLLPSVLFDLPVRFPSLERLWITVALPRAASRTSVLGRRAQSIMCRLQSLTVSYPDAEDALFSIDAPHLNHLSLRDWPRHYHHIHSSIYVSNWGAPILTSAECLAILNRMSTSLLRRLELVSQADHQEDELLRHVTTAYPYLSHIELHRYRKNHNDAVPYEEIALRLASVKYRQRVRLNLDLLETTGPMCSPYDTEVQEWLSFFIRVGREMLTIFLSACPMVTRLELLAHYEGHSTWAYFWPNEDQPANVNITDTMGNREDSTSLPFIVGKRGC